MEDLFISLFMTLLSLSVIGLTVSIGSLVKTRKTIKKYEESNDKDEW